MELDRSLWVIATLRRLATKVGTFPLTSALGEELRPVQLGFATRVGCEAAVHAARRFVRDGVGGRVLLKIDLRNAFNCIRRDAFLSSAPIASTESLQAPLAIFFLVTVALLQRRHT